MREIQEKKAAFDIQIELLDAAISDADITIPEGKTLKEVKAELKAKRKKLNKSRSKHEREIKKHVKVLNDYEKKDLFGDFGNSTFIE